MQLEATLYLAMWTNRVTLSCTLVLLGPLWTHTLTQACPGEEPPRDEVLAWFKGQVLEGLGLEEPSVPGVQGPERGKAGRGHRRSSRALGAAGADWPHHHRELHSEISQIILFPSSDSSCARSDSAAEDTATSHFTYYFQPSMDNQELMVTLAHFWFYAGEGAGPNSSAPLFVLTSEQQLNQAAEAPSMASSDGWTTYHLEQDIQAAVSEGPFVLQVRCPTCQCHADELDKMPFLHLHAQPRDPDRSPRRRAAAAAAIPWSSTAIELLQRPLQERPEYGDCQREEIEISFEELGWGNWIVHPKVLTFHYCHGNCSAVDRTAAALGIKQCCAPVPGTMQSLRITTTSDGGYSFKYETLPNIIPEECTCI